MRIVFNCLENITAGCTEGVKKKEESKEVFEVGPPFVMTFISVRFDRKKTFQHKDRLRRGFASIVRQTITHVARTNENNVPRSLIN